jgi:hypothetical protein
MTFIDNEINTDEICTVCIGKGLQPGGDSNHIIHLSKKGYPYSAS